MKHLISLLVALCLIFSGACKKGTTTGPDGAQTLEFSGIVTTDGGPFPNVDVYLSWSASKKTTTGADGRFSFTNVTGGNYIVTPSRAGYAFNPSNYPLDIQARNDLNFQAQGAVFGSNVNDITADFMAKDQNNNSVSLYSHFGKVILITLSADWCGPCREEATHLEGLYDRFKDKGFQAITLLISGSPSSWSQEYGLTIPILDDNAETIWDIYGEGYFPLNIILDRNCVIRYKRSGYNENEIVDIILKYL